MVEVRKFCCCASNLLCAEILGGIGIALVFINLAFWIVAVIAASGTAHGFQPVMALPLVNYLISLVANLCLVIGASKKNKSLLLVWLVLASIALLLYIAIFILACLVSNVAGIISYLIAIGLTIWTILVVYGAYQEIKYC